MSTKKNIFPSPVCSTALNKKTLASVSWPGINYSSTCSMVTHTSEISPHQFLSWWPNGILVHTFTVNSVSIWTVAQF